MGHGRDIWKRRYFESDALASRPENRCDLVLARTILGSIVAALSRKTSLHPGLGGAVLCYWLYFLALCVAALEYPAGNVRGSIPVLGFVKRFPCIWAIAFVVWAVDIMFFGGMSMAINNYGSRPVLAVIGSIAGTLCVIGISQLIDRVPALGSVLSSIGQASLAILCVHLIEDNVLPWQMYLGALRMAFPQVPLVLLSFIVRLPIDLCGAFLLYYVPVIREWFYPQLAKRNAWNLAVETR